MNEVFKKHLSDTGTLFLKEVSSGKRDISFKDTGKKVKRDNDQDEKEYTWKESHKDRVKKSRRDFTFL